jgi:plasmid stabilization system protein ParE
MKVVWSDDAAWALVALETRLAKRYSSDKAARIVAELVRRVDRLEDHPQLGRVVPEYGQWQLRELVDRWNRVLYRLRSDAVEVVTIVPTRMPLDERNTGDE